MSRSIEAALAAGTALHTDHRTCTKDRHVHAIRAVLHLSIPHGSCMPGPAVRDGMMGFDRPGGKGFLVSCRFLSRSGCRDAEAFRLCLWQGGVFKRTEVGVTQRVAMSRSVFVSLAPSSFRFYPPMMVHLLWFVGRSTIHG